MVSAPMLHFSVRSMLGSNARGGKVRTLVQREVQAEERPAGILKRVEPSGETPPAAASRPIMDSKV
jgi:hypothetical protein